MDSHYVVQKVDFDGEWIDLSFHYLLISALTEAERLFLQGMDVRVKVKEHTIPPHSYEWRRKNG